MLVPLEVPDHDIARFSLSAAALSGARATHLLITGNDKRAALERARSLPAHLAPVRVVLDDAIVHWSAA
jgi:6-phosphogluconolactonase